LRACDLRQRALAAKPNSCEHAIEMKQRLFMASTNNLVLGPEPARANVCLRLMTTTKQSRDEWWSPWDLFFLRDALERGMTCAEVGGFLSRGEAEVRKKAKQLKISYRQVRHYTHYRIRRGR
jgi:hypothetical protein